MSDTLAVYPDKCHLCLKPCSCPADLGPIMPIWEAHCHGCPHIPSPGALGFTLYVSDKNKVPSEGLETAVGLFFASSKSRAGSLSGPLQPHLRISCSCGWGTALLKRIESVPGMGLLRRIEGVPGTGLQRRIEGVLDTIS